MPTNTISLIYRRPHALEARVMKARSRSRSALPPYAGAVQAYSPRGCDAPAKRQIAGAARRLAEELH